MQFIVHFKFSTNASHLVFNLGRRMLYCFDEEMYVSGVGYTYHYMLEEIKDRNFDFKINYLIKQSNDNEKEEVEEFYKNYKIFLKSKNKDSKWIVQTNIAKREVERRFNFIIDDQSAKMESTLGTSTFRELHDSKKICFYGIEDPNIPGERDTIIPVEEILSLKIADEGDIPILFLGNEDVNGKELFDLETKDISKNDYKNGYLVDVFQFPCMLDVQATELKSIAYEFSKEIQPIKEQLKKWATMAYKNSNSKEGQQFFIKNISPIIEKNRKTALQINATQDAKSRHPANYTFHLQFGELPIDKIWELYKSYNHATDEEYQKLLKLKEENPKKYSGRWPVVFFKCDYKGIYRTQNIEGEQEQMPTTRKTLDID